MTYALPSPPASGIGVDSHGITWRLNGVGTWDPDACPQCGSRVGGAMSWPDLLGQRGPISDPTP